MPAKKNEPKTIDFAVVERGQFEACLLGTTPMLCHSMNAKSQRQLLYPSGPKTPAQKQAFLKHEPYEEFRDSPYTDPNPKAPTVIQIVASGVKKSMAQIAVDLPDTSVKKAQLERLLYVPDEKIHVWGIPLVDMRYVRMSDPNRTPDIRTRAILPHWAAKVRIAYVTPVLTKEVVTRLLVTSGFMGGLGDYRVQKGGSFGTFEVVSPKDPRFLNILKTGNRKAQKNALDNPDFYNEDSRALYQWFIEERIRRGREDEAKEKAAKEKAARKAKKKDSKAA